MGSRFSWSAQMSSPWWWMLLSQLIPLLCESCPCERRDQLSLIPEVTESRTHCFLALHHCSLSWLVSFLVWKRKSTWWMLHQHEVHFTPHPLESQRNCEITACNSIWSMTFEGGTRTSVKSHFFGMSSPLPFHVFPVGYLAIFHTEHVTKLTCHIQLFKHWNYSGIALHAVL